MRKLFAIILLLIINSEAFAQIADSSKKTSCEKSNGNWQIFNNNCADICDNKFEHLFCTSVLIFSCKCSPKYCWDGDKCVPEKDAKIAWLEKKKDANERRQAEIEAIKLKSIAASQPTINNPINQNSASPTSANANPAAAPATNPEAAIPPINVAAAPPLDPETERKNAEQKEICQKQNGIWKEFKNGCADNCGSQVSQTAMCTMKLTFGCECGNSKCFDNNKNICVEIEEYKKSLNEPKPIIKKPEETLPTNIPASDLQSINKPDSSTSLQTLKK